MTPTFTGTLYWLFNFQFQLCQWKFAPCLMITSNDDKSGPRSTVRWSSSRAGSRTRSRIFLVDTNMTTAWRPSCLAPRRASARTGPGRGGGLQWWPPGPGSSTPCHHSGQCKMSLLEILLTQKTRWRILWWYKWCRLFHHQKLNGLSTFILKILGLHAECRQNEQKV